MYDILTITSSIAELVGAIVFSFALAVVYEGLKTVRNMVAKKTKHFLYQPNQEKSKISMELDAPVIKCRYILGIWMRQSCNVI